MTAQTPGQAAFEEWKRHFDANLLEDWTEDLADSERAGWEAVAQVGSVALVNLAEVAKESQRAWDELVNSKQERHPSREVNLITDDEREQSAPELAAAIDPDKLDMLADWFDADDLAKGRSGRTEVQEDLRRWAKLVRDARDGLESGRAQRQ